MYRSTDAEQTNPRFKARNLQMVMDFIDLENPNQSRLLIMALEKHGPANVAPLGGVNDPKYRELRDWVFSVSQTWSVDVATLGKEAARRPASPPTAPEKVEGAFAADQLPPPPVEVEIPDRLRRPERRPAPDRSADLAKPAARPPVAVFGAADDSPESSPAIMGPPVRKPKSSPGAPDPFDPSAFNRDAKPPVQEEQEPEVDPAPKSPTTVESSSGPSVEWSNPPAAPAEKTFPVDKGAQLSPTNRFKGLFKAPSLPFGTSRKSK